MRQHRVTSQDFECMNSLSCQHLQNLKLDELNFKILSQAINIHHFKFDHQECDRQEDLESDENKEEFEVAIEQTGRVDAILYWFEVQSTASSSIKESTFHSPIIDKAAFLLDRPMLVDPIKTDFLTIEFTYQDFLIDLSVTD